MSTAILESVLHSFNDEYGHSRIGSVFCNYLMITVALESVLYFVIDEYGVLESLRYSGTIFFEKA